MKAKAVSILAAMLLIPSVLGAGVEPDRWFCGFPYFWVLQEPALSSTANSELIELRPPNEFCSVFCFLLYDEFLEFGEAPFRILGADGAVMYSGTFRTELIRYKDYGCQDPAYIFGGRAVFRVRFTPDEGAAFSGIMEVESRRGPFTPSNAIDGIRVRIPALDLDFDQPIAGRPFFLGV